MLLNCIFKRYLADKLWYEAAQLIVQFQYVFTDISREQNEKYVSQQLIEILLQYNENKPYTNMLYQICFIFQENLGRNELQQLIYMLEERQQTNIIQICSLILTGRVTNDLKIEFIKQNAVIDKLAVKQLTQQLDHNDAIISNFLHYSLHAMSTGLFEQRSSIDSDWNQWQLFQFYQQIGLINKDRQQLAPIYKQIFKSTNDAYKLAGCLAGLAIQMVSRDVSEVLCKYLEVFDSITNYKQEDKIPIMYALGISTGLITLANNDENVKEIFYDAIRKENDVMANYGLLIGLGMISFGFQKEFQSENCQKLLKMFTSSKRSKEKQALCVAAAFMHFNCQNVDDSVISMFADNDVMPLIYGLAYYHSNNYKVEQKLLEIAMEQDGTQQGKYAILAFGLVVDQNQHQQMFDVLQQLAQSHSKFIRQGVCLILGLFYSNKPNEQVVKQLIKMMADNEELVRAYAVIGLSFVLQNVSGCKIPFHQKVELEPPIGDKLEGTIYISDYENEEDFEKATNLNQVFKEEKDIKELYNLIYVNKLPRHLTIEEITTIFRYTLVQKHKSLFIQRSFCLALGIMNCGGFCMKFNVQKDIEIVGYVLFLLSFTFYPLMAYIGLCMKPQYICSVSIENQQIKNEDIIIVADKNEANKYKISEQYRNKQLNQYEIFLTKTKLSSQELNKTQNQHIQQNDQFSRLKLLRQKSIQRYVDKLQGIKNESQKKQQNDEDDDEFTQLQLPCRCLEGLVDNLQVIEGNEYVPITKQMKQGVNVCVQMQEQDVEHE